MQRYFDGIEWTENYAPLGVAPAAEASAPGRFTIHYGSALLAIFSAIGTLIIGVPMISTASDTDGIGAGFGVLWLLWGSGWTIVWVAFAIQHTLKSRR
jgi:hypothetical protein